ncbi:hypothetical protein D3C76_1618290 [compost metagenome]
MSPQAVFFKVNGVVVLRRERHRRVAFDPFAGGNALVFEELVAHQFVGFELVAAVCLGTVACGFTLLEQAPRVDPA